MWPKYSAEFTIYRFAMNPTISTFLQINKIQMMQTIFIQFVNSRYTVDNSLQKFDYVNVLFPNVGHVTYGWCWCKGWRACSWLTFKMFQ